MKRETSTPFASATASVPGSRPCRTMASTAKTLAARYLILRFIAVWIAETVPERILLFVAGAERVAP